MVNPCDDLPGKLLFKNYSHYNYITQRIAKSTILHSAILNWERSRQTDCA